MSLSLSTHRDGRKYGTVTSHGEEYRVKIVSTDKGKYVAVYVVGGDIRSYRQAGLLSKRAIGLYNLRSADAQDRISGGYDARGTVADLAERVVHEFLNVHHDALREAAKTPEQREAEAEERHQNIQRGQQKRIAAEAEELLATLDALVPATTVHYAIEDARKALATLIRTADTVKTRGSLPGN